MSLLLCGRSCGEEFNQRKNLFRRGIISNENSWACVLCLEAENSFDHLFFNFPFFAKVWNSCHKRMNVSTTLPNNSREHFLQRGGEWWTKPTESVGISANAIMELNEGKKSQVQFLRI